jgi:hypothetical protein
VTRIIASGEASALRTRRANERPSGVRAVH